MNAYLYVCMLRYRKMTTESSPRSAKNETPIQKKKYFFMETELQIQNGKNLAV